MQALNGNPATRGAWKAIHALSYHTYLTDFDIIVNETTSLHQQFNKPVWITEIASGADSTAAANLALMQRFVPWANSQPWIERYFWNQAVRYQKLVHVIHVELRPKDTVGDFLIWVLMQVFLGCQLARYSRWSCFVICWAVV